jgi:hypothetical protein
MIIIRRVVKSKSSANFAKALPDWTSQSTSYYSPDSYNSRKAQKNINRGYRRDAKLLQRRQYYNPNPSYSPDPIYEQKVKQYQFKQAVKNAPDFDNMYWDEAEEARAKAREKFSENTRKVTDEVKENASKNLGGNKSKIDPRLLLAGLGVAGAVGAGAYFIRRRRSKNGKQIVERVKR